MSPRPVVANSQTCQLGEGPVWDSARSRLLWVDVLAGTAFEGALIDDRIEVVRQHQFDSMVSAVVPGANGELLLAGQEHLIRLRADGTWTTGPRIVPSRTRRRLNDAATDPAGRLLVGTLSLDGPGSTTEALVRIEPDGTITTIDDDLTLSNGLAWSVDGHSLYSVDSFRRTIFVREYDATTGEVGPRRVHLELIDALPDGIAVDADDHLWVAAWGAGELRRFAPGGALVDCLRLPAPHTSSLAFAGDDLRTLVVTTATSELSEDQLTAFPGSGCLFTFRVDVPGLATPPWAGASIC